MTFGGDTYERNEDFLRLSKQVEQVRYLMTNPIGKWWTLAELSRLTIGSEAGISARIRDLRKAPFGGFEVERERVEGGLWKYRVAKPDDRQMDWTR